MDPKFSHRQSPTFNYASARVQTTPHASSNNLAKNVLKPPVSTRVNDKRGKPRYNEDGMSRTSSQRSFSALAQGNSKKNYSSTKMSEERVQSAKKKKVASSKRSTKKRSTKSAKKRPVVPYLATQEIHQNDYNTISRGGTVRLPPSDMYHTLD